jgi:diaminopimelate epimerase
VRAESRWHAHGNEYLLVERGGEQLTPEDVRALCADADGVVEVLTAHEDEVEVVIWNADGSTAEMSGNGTRIAACWLARRTGAERVRVRVGPREVEARLLATGDVETDLGEVVVHGRECVAGVDVTVVSVGNPHAVIVGEPSDVVDLGPLLASHQRFPQGTNVEVVRVDAPGEVTARVWERGVGETTASGTGAVAAAAATHAEGTVTVRFPGGDLRVRLERGRAYLTGPAERLP